MTEPSLCAAPCCGPNSLKLSFRWCVQGLRVHNACLGVAFLRGDSVQVVAIETVMSEIDIFCFLNV